MAGFVRALPADLPVKRLIELARESGFEMAESYVYAIRARHRRALCGEAAPPTATGTGSTHRVDSTPAAPLACEPLASEPATLAPPPGPCARPTSPSPHEVDRELARLILEVRIARAERILALLKSRLPDVLLPLAVPRTDTP